MSTPSRSRSAGSPAGSRLTVLWALNETGLGGLLHAVRSPLTGLFVGGVAVLLVRLLAHVAGGRRRELAKATGVVMLAKLAASPHSPLTAHVAVAFQGLSGALLLGPRARGPAIVGHALLCYLQMSLQRVVKTTILYGLSLWQAIDGLAAQAARALPGWHLGEVRNASLWLIGVYLGLHLTAGLLIGLFSVGLPQRLRRHAPPPLLAPEPESPPFSAPLPRSRGARLRGRLLRSLPVLAFLAAAWWLLPEGGRAQALRAVLRAALMLLFWYHILSPLGLRLVKRILRKRSSAQAQEVEATLARLPELRRLTRALWQREQGRRPASRAWQTLLGLMSWALTGAADGR